MHAWWLCTCGARIGKHVGVIEHFYYFYARLTDNCGPGADIGIGIGC